MDGLDFNFYIIYKFWFQFNFMFAKYKTTIMTNKLTKEQQQYSNFWSKSNLLLSNILHNNLLFWIWHFFLSC